MAKTPKELGAELQAAQNVARVVGGRQALADLEKARKALSDAAKVSQRERKGLPRRGE